MKSVITIGRERDLVSFFFPSEKVRATNEEVSKSGTKDANLSITLRYSAGGFGNCKKRNKKSESCNMKRMRVRKRKRSRTTLVQVMGVENLREREELGKDGKETCFGVFSRERETNCRNSSEMISPQSLTV